MVSINVGTREAEKKLVGYVDMTPTWGEVLPTLLQFVEHGNTEQQDIARKELTKMATTADAYNAMQRELAKQITTNTAALMELLGGKP